MKRKVRYSFDIPREANKRFSVVVKDKVSFGSGKGPFDIEIVVIGFVFLKDEMRASQIKTPLRDNGNANFLVNQCLPHTSAAVAYLTDRMGFNPIILAPKYPASSI
ncbi:MAG: hypothetical protein HZB54_01310 [Deltaproteobacteria bacterium]|nr:hypothetical protein [Deltaproteobacteria bacterium]